MIDHLTKHFMIDHYLKYLHAPLLSLLSGYYPDSATAAPSSHSRTYASLHTPDVDVNLTSLLSIKSKPLPLTTPSAPSRSSKTHEPLSAGPTDESSNSRQP